MTAPYKIECRRKGIEPRFATVPTWASVGGRLPHLVANYDTIIVSRSPDDKAVLIYRKGGLS